MRAKGTDGATASGSFSGGRAVRRRGGDKERPPARTDGAHRSSPGSPVHPIGFATISDLKNCFPPGICGRGPAAPAATAIR
ncbi:hypothetical protein EVAR_19570_1 [Eumeta japonica]|uniref:Uncharacterized protein n=1 Tax=Eumeta variegata TaxID=151549 RepID=A0A4C1UG14_EUMVA|nr:hypothetical protein EVAR_19570_1 [Eumeta japonica]